MSVVRFKLKKRLVGLLLVMAIAGCSVVNEGADQTISAAITRQFDSYGNEAIDFSQIGSVGWQRMCIFGPYAMNDTVEKTLGFKWDELSKSSIGSNEGINLLVFVKDNAVIAYTEHPRNKGDFLDLKSPCLTRQDAILKRVPNPGGCNWCTPRRFNSLHAVADSAQSVARRPASAPDSDR